jgi:hypothetical protein
VIRLAFELPPFSRITWASGPIRSTWGERLSRVRRALAHLERPACWSGILPARIVKIYPYQERQWTEEARKAGLAVERYEAAASDMALDEELRGGKAILLLAGQPEVVSQARAEGSSTAPGTPDCCARHAELMRPLAFRSREMILMLSSAPDAEPGGYAVVAQAWETNLFWSGIGVSLLPHVPCSVHCEPSKTLARKLLVRMKQSSFDEEAEWLREMLSWSLSWSALHGIAELKTPLLKACSATDATARRYEIRLDGTSPKEAPAGAGFPYQTKYGRRSSRTDDVPLSQYLPPRHQPA